MGTRASAGGAAAAGGFGFQAQVTAWLATFVLAEASAPWSLAPAALSAVGAETSREVDDIGSLSSVGGMFSCRPSRAYRPERVPRRR
jgi:hypothetical protein